MFTSMHVVNDEDVRFIEHAKGGIECYFSLLHKTSSIQSQYGNILNMETSMRVANRTHNLICACDAY